MTLWREMSWSAAVRRTAARLTLLAACAVVAGDHAVAQSDPAPATRAPAPPAVVPAPEAVAVMMGSWEAEIPDEYGGVTEWRLHLEPDGQFSMEVRSAGGETELRSGTYEIDSQAVRLFFPTADADPNSTALNLADARSLETYFYRLLGEDRLAFRPTLCRIDPCQWIAARVE